MIRVAWTLLLGAAAALACEGLGTPLPWTIGPLVATAAFGVAGVPLAASAGLRNAGQWAIGTALGLYFTPPVVALVLGQAGAIVAGVAWALAIGAAFGAFLRRANAGPRQPDAATAWFAGAIGSATEMAVLAERHGARVDLVASAHSLRVLIVVVGVPVAFRYARLDGIDPTLPGPREVLLPGPGGARRADGAGRRRDAAAEADQPVDDRPARGRDGPDGRRPGTVRDAEGGHQRRRSCSSPSRSARASRRPSCTSRRAGSAAWRSARWS